MASNREMNALGRDPARVRSLTLGLLKLAETAEYIFTDWELTFLRSLVGQAETTVGLTKKQREKQKDAGVALAMRDFRLTARQAEKLLDIRDATVLHRDIGGVSVRSLINRCYEGRCALAEDDEEFITRLHSSGVAELRRNDLARLKRCSVQLGELEEYMMM
jgi:hypothetical protein